MIKIKVSKGIPYIWDVSDWIKLRTEHRIIGTFDGAEGTGWTNPIHLHLPVKLSTVETQFLVSRGIAQTFCAPSLLETDVPFCEEVTAKRKDSQKKSQLEAYKVRRKEEIEYYVDRMLEGKIRKGKTVLLDKESFIQDELDKIIKTPYEMHTVDLKDFWLKEEDYIPYNFPTPNTYLEKVRFRVFEDFHLNKKYYLSPGVKFGGDFLAYPDDPLHYHAEFIIMCEDNKRKFSELHLVSQCRLANTVKKTLLIAVIDEITDKLMYYLPHQKIFSPKENPDNTLHNNFEDLPKI